MVFDVLGDIMVDAGWQGQVEETVGSCTSRQRHQVCMQVGEGALIIVLPTYIGVTAEEDRETVCFSVRHLRKGDGGTLVYILSKITHTHR